MRENRNLAIGYRSALTALGLAFVVALLAPPLGAEEGGLPLRFNATAVNMSGTGPSGSARLDIRVNRWSSEEERASLVEALKDPARRSLPDALFQQDSVGRIREIRGTGEDLRYSRAIPTENGQQLILATDRPLGFVEATRGSRTTRYNVTLVVLDLDAEGNGEGQLMMGAELTFDEEKNQVVIEHFASQPIRLMSVRLR